MVDTEADDFVSGVVVVVFTPGVPRPTEILLVLGITHVTKNTGRFTDLKVVLTIFLQVQPPQDRMVYSVS
jgi:hypothetical protein